MLQPFRRTDAKDPETRQLQDAVASVFKDLTTRELLDGHLLSPVTITAGTPLTINHGLDRKPKWLVVTKNAQADVWDSQATNKTPSKTLVLNASATVTVELWVF